MAILIQHIVNIRCSHFHEEEFQEGVMDKACPLPIAQFYIAEVVQALMYLHSQVCMSFRISRLIDRDNRYGGKRRTWEGERSVRLNEKQDQ